MKLHNWKIQAISVCHLCKSSRPKTTHIFNDWAMRILQLWLYTASEKTQFSRWLALPHPLMRKGLVTIITTGIRKLFDQAASASITSSGWILLAKDCNEWTFECWQFYCMIYFCICYSLPLPPMRFTLICGSVSPRTHPTYNLFVYNMLFSSTFWWFFSLNWAIKSHLLIIIVIPAMHAAGQPHVIIKLHHMAGAFNLCRQALATPKNFCV